MNIERVTRKAQKAILAAKDLAVRMGHQQLDSDHLHLALITQEDGLIPKLIKYMGRSA